MTLRLKSSLLNSSKSWNCSRRVDGISLDESSSHRVPRNSLSNLKAVFSAAHLNTIALAANSDFTQVHLTPMLIGAETLSIRP
ncbi:MAG: hypothetical protein V7776_02620 [Halopseudomonas aestusnigri]